MATVTDRPDDVTPENVTVQKIDEAGYVKVRFTLDGKRYKMLMETDTFNSLETEPGQEIKELTLKEGTNS